MKVLVLHGILHLAGFDHERDNGEMARKEASLRRSLRLPSSLTERGEDRWDEVCQPPTRWSAFEESFEDGMNFAVFFALLLLVGLLTLVSYVDRVYQEAGKFLSREFQDNIDVFERKVEPALKVSRSRAALSMAVLTQLTTAAIALLIGYLLFQRSGVERL